LQHCCGRVCLNEAERWWIATLDSMAPKGYNLTTGGEGAIPCEETRKKMSETMKRRMTPEKMKALLDLAHAGVRGSKWTPERHAMRKARVTPEEECKKISAGNKGKKRSPESRERYRAAALRRKLDEETKRKISEAHKGKPAPWMRGNKNWKKRVANNRITKTKDQLNLGF